MHIYQILCSLAVCYAMANVGSSAPMDRRAHDALALAQAVSASERKLTESDLETVMNAAQSDNAQLRMAAAYALSFADTKAGEKSLLALCNDSDATVAGVAQFAVLRKSTADLKPSERIGVLSLDLGRKDQAYSRALIAMWLGDHYGSEAVPTLIAALDTESDHLVRGELFFQIAVHGDKHQLRTVRQIIGASDDNSGQTAWIAQIGFFNRISLHSKPARASTPRALERLIESRLAELGNEE